ncbi:MAG: GspH/FimT family pseudopilin [Gammaproteobacteria bacterium]
MKRKKVTGFTIIELMLTIAIAGVLLAVAVPSFKDMAFNNCLTTKANAMVSAMQLARSSAITLRDDVSVGSLTCHYDQNSDGSADGTCTSGDEFGEGVIVFRDIDGNGLADPNVEDTDGDGVLDVGEDVNGNGVLDTEVVRISRFGCAATVDETSDSTMITYTLKGFAETEATLNICDERASSDYEGRQISLSFTGRPATDGNFTCP